MVEPLRLKENKVWSGSIEPRISVVMIGHSRADFLARAISSLVAHSPNAGWEMILIVNGGSPAVKNYAEELQRRASFPLKLVEISESLPGAARNYGVKAARGPILFFLDDDIECFQDILSAAMHLFRDPLLQAAGGANLTPPGSSALARTTGGVMSTWLGAASMSRRYRVTVEGHANEHDLILCNLAVRKSIFDREQGFAIHLVSNEENVLLQRLSAKGSKLWSSPKLAVFHHRRDTWFDLCYQAAKYGGGRAQNLRLLPETISVVYFLPMFLLAYLLLVPLSFIWLDWLALLPLFFYFGTALLFSTYLAIRCVDVAQFMGALVFPAIHISYGVGFLRRYFFDPAIVWAQRVCSSKKERAV